MHPQHLQHSSLASLMLDRTVDFSWEQLGYHVKVDDGNGESSMKPLLCNVTGTARGGRVLAIMGPSGAGKTTLMNGIIGRLQVDAEHRLDGCAFLNDTVFSNRYKKLVSYVAQDDIVMGKETPAEALYFSARVRLGLSVEEAQERTEDILTRLRLQKCRDTYLGIPGLIKGVSGGEKKRVNIGNELITNPYVLLLDEPTTGLDSVNALRVGELLRDLAHEEKRTVLCTIHSPSSELFALFDDLLLFAKGHVVYHGPTSDAPDYFASVGYPVPPRTNPSEYFMNLLQLPREELQKLWDAWEAYLASPASANNLSVLPMGDTITTRSELLEKHLADKQGASLLIETVELTKRSMRLFLRDPGSTIGRAVQTIFFAVLVGLFFFGLDKDAQGVQDRAGALFMVMMNNMFMAAMSGLASFPPERAVFLMEQGAEAYSAWAYSAAKSIAELPFQIIFPTIFTCIAYFMMGFVETASAFFAFWIIVVLLANTGYSFGLMCASVFPTAEAAFAAVPLVFMPLSIVAGLFANTDRLDPYWIWLNYLSFPRFAYTALFTNEFGKIGEICGAGNPCPYPSGDFVIRLYGFEDDSWERSAWVLALFTIGFKVIGAFSLWVQGRAKAGNLRFEGRLASRQASPQNRGASPRQADYLPTPATEQEAAPAESKPDEKVATPANQPEASHEEGTHEPIEENEEKAF